MLPGFVDAHAHPVFGGNRVDEFEMRARGATYEEIAASGGGIRSTVRKTRAATEEAVARAGEEARGVVSAGRDDDGRSEIGLRTSVEDEMKILRVIRRLNTETPVEFVPTFLGAHAIPEEFATRRSNTWRWSFDEMLPRVVEERLAEYLRCFLRARLLRSGGFARKS